MSAAEGSRRSGRGLSVPSPATALRVRVELIGTPVWRTLELDSTLGLDAMVQVLQAVIGWRNVHLHEVITDSPRPVDDWAVPVGVVLPGRGSTLTYLYDLQRRHEHLVTVTSVVSRTESDPRAHLREGAGACPADHDPAPFGADTGDGHPVPFSTTATRRSVADAVHLPHGRQEIAETEAGVLAWYVARIGDGVDLTSTGRLRRGHVSAILRDQGWGDGVPGGPVVGEDRAYPVRALDSRARSLGLVKVEGRRLVVTHRGHEAADDPATLARWIVDRFPRTVLWGTAPRGWVARR